ncbi:MAG: hypothetical protein IPN14_12370 [Bacteroidetes bacterium]|nr:hypothetical protein [Bacteroidota bacterium]
MNPLELFLRKPVIESNYEIGAEMPTITNWESSINLSTVEKYFNALIRVLEICNDDKFLILLFSIKDEEENMLTWFRNVDVCLEITLPLIAYIEKFSQGNLFYYFVRRIRKNYYNNLWDERKVSYVDWRHILQIIEFAKTEDEVLNYEVLNSNNKFKNISNVTLNEWYNNEEKTKNELKRYKTEIEEWEDHIDFQGDLSFLFSINEKIGIANSIENFSSLQKYYQNYISTIDLIRSESEDPSTAKLSNLFRLFMHYIECHPIEHKNRVAPNIEGVLFSTINRNHLLKEDFKNLISKHIDELETYCKYFIINKIDEWDVFNLTEENYSLGKMIRCWLTLKVFNAINNSVCLAYYDGRNSEEGVSAYKNFNDNKLLPELPFSLENMICGFGVKSGGNGSYVEFTDTDLWFKPNVIDTPFIAVSRNPEDRNADQIAVNKYEIELIVKFIK